MHNINHISLPSGKIINNVDNISTVTLLEAHCNEYSSPAREWVEFDVIYKDGHKVELTYESLSQAAADRDVLREVVVIGVEKAKRIY